MASQHQATLKKQMAKVQVNPQNATAFYSHFFTVAPDLRVFFKGAETMDPKDVPASERFQKQGQRLLTSVHVLVEIWSNPPIYDAFVKDLMDKHKRFKGVGYPHYEAFFSVFRGYLEKLIGPLSHEENKAWDAMKEDFLKTCKPYI